MQKIIIQDLHNVIIDGKNCDDIFAAIQQNPSIESNIKKAALGWSSSVSDFATQLTESRDALAEADARTAAATAECSRLAKLLADASAAFDAGDIATLTAMRAAALQTENEKKLAAARAKKAEAEAEIAALTE